MGLRDGGWGFVYTAPPYIIKQVFFSVGSEKSTCLNILRLPLDLTLNPQPSTAHTENKKNKQHIIKQHIYSKVFNT